MTLTSLLRLNAASCLGFGLLFVLIPVRVTGLLGDAPWLVVLVLGAGLIGNGIHLMWASMAPRPVWMIRYFSIGDGLWVVATLFLVLSGMWITTVPGILISLLVAAGVGTLGALQWRHIGQANLANRRDVRAG